MGLGGDGRCAFISGRAGLIWFGSFGGGLGWFDVCLGWFAGDLGWFAGGLGVVRDVSMDRLYIPCSLITGVY